MDYELEAISPIDGRYRRHTKSLAEFFSEKALIKYRVMVEGEYFIFLSEHPQIRVRDFSKEEKGLVRKLYDVSTEDAEIVKGIETKGYKDIKATNHDVKAVEYFMRDKLSNTSLKDSLEGIHFGLTSNDINNIAYSLILSDALEKVILPSAEELYENIEKFAQKHKNIIMLARTHGQPSSPTTVGKEFKVFSSRLKRQLYQLKNHNLLAKLNGATGNYNAHQIAYPEVDWLNFTREFIEKFNDKRKIKLKPNFITTQIEPHDSYAELSDNLRRLNTIVIDFDQDIWRYISDGWIKLKPVEGEVGSSTMPQKVNPIDFENSEGNLGIANALFEFFSRKLPISRLQRDLSDSTVKRNLGVALSYSLIAYKSTLKGLSKIAINEDKVVEEVKNNPQLIAEAIQTILRRENVEGAYEKLKELTRGKKVTMDDFRAFIEELNVSDEIRGELKKITPNNYTGIAKLIVESD
jgi:adenylosuccinate lyase